MEKAAAKAYLLRILGRRDYSTAEIRRKLVQRGVSSPLIQELIEEFIQVGYLNDERYAEALARQNVRKKKGPLYLQRTLLSKGLPMRFSSPEEGQSDIINELLDTKYGKNNLKDPQQRLKVAQSLLRRGFKYDIIFSTLENHLNQKKN